MYNNNNRIKRKEKRRKNEKCIEKNDTQKNQILKPYAIDTCTSR